MSPAIWSLITAGASIVGLWIGGNNPRHGWIYGLGCQVLWATEGCFTHRPGDIILSFAFVIVYGRNLRRWRGTRFKPAAKPEPESVPCGSDVR